MNGQEFVRLLILIGCAGVIIESFLIYKSIPRKCRFILVLANFWVVHAALFTVVAWLRVWAPVSLNVWSSGIRGHALISLMLGGIQFWITKKHV